MLVNNCYANNIFCDIFITEWHSWSVHVQSQDAAIQNEFSTLENHVREANIVLGSRVSHQSVRNTILKSSLSKRF